MLTAATALAVLAVFVPPAPDRPPAIAGERRAVHQAVLVNRHVLYLHIEDGGLKLSAVPVANKLIRVGYEVTVLPGGRFQSITMFERGLLIGYRRHDPRPPVSLTTSDLVNLLSAEEMLKAGVIFVGPKGLPLSASLVPPALWSRSHHSMTLKNPRGDTPANWTYSSVAVGGTNALRVFDIIGSAGRVRDAAGDGYRMEVTAVRPQYDAARKAWLRPEASSLGTISVPFLEPFHAYTINDNYYFVTDSGSVYLSPAPLGAAPRRVSRLNSGNDGAIKLVVENAGDRDSYFLFGTDGSGKWYYSKLGEKLFPVQVSNGGPEREVGSAIEVVRRLAEELYLRDVIRMR